jgi:ABC-2 type transport system ATP-binding protein
MMCNRLLIMHDGKILASDTPENLQRLVSNHSQIIAEIAAPIEAVRECWLHMPQIEYFEVAPGIGEFQRCVLTPRNGLDVRPQIFTAAQQRGWVIRELTRNRHSLEDIYVQITQPWEEENE